MTQPSRTTPTSAPSAIVFVNGFHRSGTTVLTAALTEALPARTTTVADLGRHIPSLKQLLQTLDREKLDRGVDRLEVSASMPEEYGHFLYQATGRHALYEADRNVALLRSHIRELRESDPAAIVVLKNPWDFGHEARILTDFPEAKIVLLRRRLADIERSAIDALTRIGSSTRYLRALTGDRKGDRFFESVLASASWKRAVLLSVLRWRLRLKVLRLSHAVGRLPRHRVAYLSYDELRSNAQAGASWAAHIVEPARLAEAFDRRVFAERRTAATSASGWITNAFDALWNRAWQRARAAQVRERVLEPPLLARSISTSDNQTASMPAR
jgi:hypothetical protein